MTQTAHAAVQVKKYADGLGIAVDALSEMDFVSQRLNVDINVLRGQMFNLTQALNEAAETGKGITDDLTRFGLSAKDAAGHVKPLPVFLDEVRRKMQSMTAIQRADIADKLFFDEETIALLTVAPDKLADLTAEARKLGVLTRQDAARAQEFVNGLTNIGRAIEGIKIEVGAMFFEPLSKFFKKVADGISIFRRHNGVLKEFLILIGLLTTAFAALGIKAAIGWAMTLSPITLVVAGIAAISAAAIILKEDFTAFFNGASSATGDFLKQFPMLEKAFRKFGDYFGYLLFRIVEDFKALGGWVVSIGGDIKEFLLSPIESTIEALKNLFGWIKKLPGSIGKKLTIAAEGGFSGLMLPAVSAPGVQTVYPTPAANQNKNSVSVGNININAPGADTEEIAKQIESELQKTFQNTAEDMDSGIKQ